MEPDEMANDYNILKERFYNMQIPQNIYFLHYKGIKLQSSGYNMF